MGPGLVFWREDRLWATEQVRWVRTATSPAGRRRKELLSEGVDTEKRQQMVRFWSARGRASLSPPIPEPLIGVEEDPSGLSPLQPCSESHGLVVPGPWLHWAWVRGREGVLSPPLACAAPGPWLPSEQSSGAAAGFWAHRGAQAPADRTRSMWPFLFILGSHPGTHRAGLAMLGKGPSWDGRF